MLYSRPETASSYSWPGKRRGWWRVAPGGEDAAVGLVLGAPVDGAGGVGLDLRRAGGGGEGPVGGGRRRVGLGDRGPGEPDVFIPRRLDGVRGGRGRSP